jgi:hypothetical protein
MKLKENKDQQGKGFQGSDTLYMKIWGNVERWSKDSG